MNPNMKPKKDNWHQKKMYKKQKFSKFKSKENSDSETSCNREIPTPVIDVADSSDDRYSKRSIWYQREYGPEPEPEAEDIDDLIDGANFGELQKAGSGGHFVFKKEKQWEEQIEEKPEVETNSYFTMNMKLLKAGLMSIPFYKRMDYDISMFSKSQLKHMNDVAENNEKEYQNELKIFEETKRKLNSKSFESNTTVAQPKAMGKSEDDPSNAKDDDLDELLNMTTENMKDVKLEEKTNQNLENENEISNVDEKIEITDDPAVGKEDIQEWLDGILDE